MEEELLDVEERSEINEIEGILPLLLKQGLLTEIECRIIISCPELAEKRGAVYRVIMSKNKEEAANLMNIFRNLTVKFYSKESLKLQLPALEESKSDVPNNNPFLNKKVIKNILENLHLNDIMNFRLVCRQWNSTAEILLRARSRIVFSPDILMPETFLQLSEYSLSDLPFPAFEFAKDEKNDVWEISDIQNFFNHWGKNIKDARFTRLTLRVDADSDKTPKFYDASSWFATACNITTLVITCNLNYRPVLNISWEVLASLQALHHLTLKRCGILIKSETNVNRITCEEIKLHNIGFKQGGKFITLRYNDVFDFRRSKHIELRTVNTTQSKCILDMGKEEFGADTVVLHHITVENWGKAWGCIEDLRLAGSPILEGNNLKMKIVRHELSQMDLSAVPQNIENLLLIAYSNIICSEPLFLPNLKSLVFEVNNNSELLTKFNNCEKLTQIVLATHLISEQPILFNARYIPSSVQVLRLACLNLEFVDDYIWEFSSGTLVLDDFEKNIVRITDLKKITSRIRAETLVVVCYNHMEIDSSNILKLVFANKQAKTIIIGAGSKNYNLHKNIPFEDSEMSKHVDKKSNYYEFKNQMGNAIPRSEFEKWLQLGVW